MKKRRPTQRACLDEETLYRKFRARLKKEEAEEKEKERKAAIEWDIEFETRPRGNYIPGDNRIREHDDPGRDWDDR